MSSDCVVVVVVVGRYIMTDSIMGVAGVLGLCAALVLRQRQRRQRGATEHAGSSHVEGPAVTSLSDFVAERVLSSSSSHASLLGRVPGRAGEVLVTIRLSSPLPDDAHSVLAALRCARLDIARAHGGYTSASAPVARGYLAGTCAARFKIEIAAPPSRREIAGMQ